MDSHSPLGIRIAGNRTAASGAIAKPTGTFKFMGVNTTWRRSAVRDTSVSDHGSPQRDGYHR